MQHCPLHLPQLTLTALLGLSGLLSLGWSQPAIAQIDTVANFDPPPMDAPGNREAGGLRSDTCASTTDTTGLMALVPDTNLGLTSKANPDLFAYVPLNNAEQAELRIFEESTGEEVFAGQVTLPENSAGSNYQYRAATIAIPLSASSVTLQPGENYLWALMLVCNDENRAEDIVVQSVVQRAGADYLSTLPTDITKQLDGISSASSVEKLATYGSAGLWHDLLSELSALVQSDPEQYQTTWVDLLTNQSMGDIAAAPLYRSTLIPLTP